LSKLELGIIERIGVLNLSKLGLVFVQGWSLEKVRDVVVQVGV